VSGPRGLIDTNVFVSARNRHEIGHSACRHLLDRIDDGELRGVVSVVSVAELRAGLSTTETGAVWKPFISHLLASRSYEIATVDVSISELAGAIRQESKLSLPDALIVATAKLLGVDFIVTQDRDIGKSQSLVATRTPREVA
jgi:predicted nucleic acid-binding protein